MYESNGNGHNGHYNGNGHRLIPIKALSGISMRELREEWGVEGGFVDFSVSRNGTRSLDHAIAIAMPARIVTPQRAPKPGDLSELETTSVPSGVFALLDAGYRDTNRKPLRKGAGSLWRPLSIETLPEIKHWCYGR